MGLDSSFTSETGAKRLRKVAKVCQDYGLRVQNSVFECRLTDAQFVLVKNKIENIINMELDNVRFYFLGNNWPRRIEMIGKMDGIDLDGELII